jgi:hypothetical protein
VVNKTLDPMSFKCGTKSNGTLIMTPSLALLDNAFVHSAASLLWRVENDMNVRNVNILGLSALVDAIVMHDRLVIDARGWEYFKESAPRLWIPNIEPFLDVTDISLPPAESIIEELVSKDNFMLICYAMSQFDHIELCADAHGDMRELYFSYSGQDIESSEVEKILDALIREKLNTNIPDVHFNLRNYEHVGTLQCFVRALQYDQLAAKMGISYLSQEFRGRVLNFFGKISLLGELQKYLG